MGNSISQDVATSREYLRQLVAAQGTQPHLVLYDNTTDEILGHIVVNATNLQSLQVRELTATFIVANFHASSLAFEGYLSNGKYFYLAITLNKAGKWPVLLHVGQNGTTRNAIYADIILQLYIQPQRILTTAQ